MNKNP